MLHIADMGVAYDPNLSAVFKALGDDTRLVILDELRARDGQSLFEICVRVVDRHGLSLSRQAISRHLETLEAAGLITTNWNGRTKIHSLNTAPLGRLAHVWIKRFL